MNAQGKLPSHCGLLEKTNCCQPLHAVWFAAPLQAGTLSFGKVFVLSWSEKMLGTFEVCISQSSPYVVPVSLVTPVTPVTPWLMPLPKNPVAEDMEPDVRANQSLPAPTVSGLAAPLGGG